MTFILNIIKKKIKICPSPKLRFEKAHENKKKKHTIIHFTLFTFFFNANQT